MSRADLVRASGLSRTTVSSLVAELIAPARSSRPTTGHAAQGRQRAAPLLVRLSAPAGGVAGVDIGHGHVRVAVADRTAPVLAEDAAARRRGRPRRRGARPRRRPWSGALAAESRARPSTDLLAVGMCVPGPDRPPVRPDPDRRSCRAGRGCCPARSSSAGSAYPVHADNDANLGALAELHQHGAARGAARRDLPEDRQRRRRRDRARRPAAPRRQRHRRRDRPRARSARTATSAAAATAAASRPRSRPPGCSSCCGRRTASRSTSSTCWRSTRRATPAYAGCSPTPAAPSAGPWPDLANSLNPELVVVGGTLGGSPTLVDGDPRLDRPLRPARHRRGARGGPRRPRRPLRGGRRGSASRSLAVAAESRNR